MRLPLVLFLALSATSAAADALPSPGRPDFADTPQPEPRPVPLDVTLALAVMAGAVWLHSQRPLKLA